MEQDRIDRIKSYLNKVRESFDKRVSKNVELNERVVQRLGSYSLDCKECEQHLLEFEKHAALLEQKEGVLEDSDLSVHKQIVTDSISHLQKKHKLVVNGSYLAVYMSLGTALGIVFGLLLLDNIAIGLPIGIGCGLAIGASLDANAKKKGLTI